MRRNILAITLGLLVLGTVSGVTLFFAYRTLTTGGQEAVAVMNAEERAAYARLSTLAVSMSSAQVYERFGRPSDNLYLMAKWRGYGGSPLSELRIYFSEDHPRKIRWLKLGYFSYERRL